MKNKDTILDIERRCDDHIKPQTKKVYIIASVLIAVCLVFLWRVSV
tara:strand:- start:23293 stop:23430 length:138 start_codon:yes stop_codon:yes gene_type:complete